jgi:lipopolysaccharide biosynthesis glycosyltransferase
MAFFRWSLKPVFISYLLENGHNKVIYTDCDIFFFESYDFLFNRLDEASVLLTPHWWNINVNANEESFMSFFSYGIFNAGFVGVSKKGLPAMEWWAKACYFKIGFFPESGIFGDQKYLDALPFKFPGTEVIRHYGCNIGEWNTEECKRTIVNDRVLINGQYPVIFVHFTQTLIHQILKGFDPLLKPYLEQYIKTFEEDGIRLSDFDSELDTHINAGIMRKIKWTLRIRTRIKSLLFRLARSL